MSLAFDDYQASVYLHSYRIQKLQGLAGHLPRTIMRPMTSTWPVPKQGRSTAHEVKMFGASAICGGSRSLLAPQMVWSMP